MTGWRLEEGAGGLRLVPVVRRSLGSATLTWADLLYSQFTTVRVYVIYFPSRFDLPNDATTTEALYSFGQRTGPATSVNVWDPTDPEFSRGLAVFDLKSPPAVVLAGGHKRTPTPTHPLNPADLYAICLSDETVLGEPRRLAAAVNGAHEVLMRGDSKEITQYVRLQQASALIAALGNIAGEIRDELLKFKPKFQLPGGASVQIG